MEFTLWNLNAQGFWGSSGSSCHAGDTVTQVLCTSNSDDIQADGVSYSISTASSPCEDSPYQSTVDSEYITVKTDSDMDKDHPDCMVTLELETDLEGSSLEPNLDIKEVTDFAVSRTKIQIGEEEEDESSDSGRADGCELVPTVDNLWNNSLVAANVNVKTEKATYNIDDFAHHLFGRLPVKNIESLSGESEDECREEMNEEEDGEEEEEEEEGEEEEGEDDEDDDVPEDSQLEDKLGLGRSRSVPSVVTRSHGYECGECSFMAATRPGLKKHIATAHPSPADGDAAFGHAVIRRLPQAACCPLASCRFRSADHVEMEAHVARHVARGATAAPQPHPPPSTHKKKVAPLNLQRVRYEREEYRCQICSYSCTIEKAFYKHLKLHSIGQSASSSSRISCVVCGKDRPTEVDMNKHMRKHRDDRYFCCDICVFRTVQLKKLIQHRRMHTGEKPHLCPHCPYRSARRDNLRSHVRRVHKKENLYCDTFSPRGLGQSAAST